MPDLVEDFEDTTYVVPISGTWDRSNARAHTGTWSFKSAVIGDGQSTEAVVTVPAGAATVTFWRRLSSELSHDYLRFFLDATQQFASSGDVDWIRSPTYDVRNVSTITFRYSKDSTVSVGDDAAYIDDITFHLPGSRTGVYTVTFDTTAGALTAANGTYDLFELAPAADRPIEIVDITIDNKSEVGDANEQMVAFTIVRGNTTTGDGTPTTPRPLDPTGTASFTAKTISSTPASDGTPVTLIAGTFNIRHGLQLLQLDMMRPKTSGSNLLCVRLQPLDNDTTFTGTIWVREL